jgi:hypothetical protein
VDADATGCSAVAVGRLRTRTMLVIKIQRSASGIKMKRYSPVDDQKRAPLAAYRRTPRKDRT